MDQSDTPSHNNPNKSRNNFHTETCKTCQSRPRFWNVDKIVIFIHSVLMLFLPSFYSFLLSLSPFLPSSLSFPSSFFLSFFQDWQTDGRKERKAGKNKGNKKEFFPASLSSFLYAISLLSFYTSFLLPFLLFLFPTFPSFISSLYTSFILPSFLPVTIFRYFPPCFFLLVLIFSLFSTLLLFSLFPLFVSSALPSFFLYFFFPSILVFFSFLLCLPLFLYLPL